MGKLTEQLLLHILALSQKNDIKEFPKVDRNLFSIDHIVVNNLNATRMGFIATTVDNNVTMDIRIYTH